MGGCGCAALLCRCKRWHRFCGACDLRFLGCERASDLNGAAYLEGVGEGALLPEVVLDAARLEERLQVADHRWCITVWYRNCSADVFKLFCFFCENLVVLEHKDSIFVYITQIE